MLEKELQTLTQASCLCGSTKTPWCLFSHLKVSRDTVFINVDLFEVDQIYQNIKSVGKNTFY